MKAIIGVTSPGERCEWCGAPAIDRVEVQPARTRKLRNGQEEILDLAIVATVCAQHATIAAGGGLNPATTMRRHARGVEQLGLLDPTGPADAIRGIDT
jgi:hypothetical protein